MFYTFMKIDFPIKWHQHSCTTQLHPTTVCTVFPVNGGDKSDSCSYFGDFLLQRMSSSGPSWYYFSYAFGLCVWRISVLHNVVSRWLYFWTTFTLKQATYVYYCTGWIIILWPGNSLLEKIWYIKCHKNEKWMDTISLLIQSGQMVLTTTTTIYFLVA